MENTKNTLIVNLYAGPGSGKSTGAAYIFAKLKMAGVDCEYVSEYAKDRVWQEDQFPLKHCQLYVTGKQCLKITRLIGKVDVMITDSPIMLGAMYTTEKPHQDVCIYEGKKYPNTLNLYIDRRKGYNPNGRNQSYAEALEIDRRVIDMLDSNGITYYHVDGTEAGYDKVVETIITMLGKTTGYTGSSAINIVSSNNMEEEPWKAVPRYDGYAGSTCVGYTSHVVYTSCPPTEKYSAYNDSSSSTSATIYGQDNPLCVSATTIEPPLEDYNNAYRDFLHNLNQTKKNDDWNIDWQESPKLL